MLLKKKIKKMGTGTYISLITSNVNGLKCSHQKTPTGRMDTKTRPIYVLSTRDPL